MDRIVVAFANEEAQRRILRLLASDGWEPAACCASGAEAIRTARKLGSAIVICGFKFRDMTATDLAAGLDGIERGLTPPLEIAENIYAMTPDARAARGIQSLPGTLEAAIHAMEADSVELDALGPHTSAQYINGKLREWEEYRTQVSQWELDKYLVTY